MVSFKFLCKFKPLAGIQAKRDHKQEVLSAQITIFNLTISFVNFDENKYDK